MTARQWWIGVAVLTAAVLAHAAFPRYEWRAVPDQRYQLVRIDRWTGRAQAGTMHPDTQWRWIALGTSRTP